MVKDLFFNVKLRIMPIVREADGLAKSSRNTYLSKSERAAAVILNSSLETASMLFKAGERSSRKLVEGVKKLIGDEPMAQIDYVEIYALPGLRLRRRFNQRAVSFGACRKIWHNTPY